MNVYLVGYRATGKSTVGRLLAKRMHRSFVDSDDEIERLTGRSIADIFSGEGETSFRDWEEKVVAELADREGMVVALGGGAVLRENNRRHIAEQSLIIWLTASVETLVKRLETDTASPSRRPRLTPEGGRREIESLLWAREPLYRQTATHIVDTEEKSPEEVVDEILLKISGSDLNQPRHQP